MAEATLSPRRAALGGRIGAAGTAQVAWRNLWRNRRRTWLMAGGIGFAAWMLIIAQSLQGGTFTLMVDNGARMMTGHVQVQHPGYGDNPRLENVLEGAPALRARIETLPDVAGAALRGQATALVSADERSFAAQVLGVEAAREAEWSTIPAAVRDGRYLAAPGEACIGSVLARNLGVSVGEEIVLLGTAKEGGVAALAAEVVGIYETGSIGLDRSFVQIPLGDFREAWALAPGEAHALVVVTDRVTESLGLARRVAAAAGDWKTLNWKELMPEAEQFIALKMAGTWLFFAVITVIVVFSVVNAFMMTIFERTQEFGMLKAIGMRPGRILFGLQVEAAWLWALGMAIALAVCTAMIVPLGVWGMPLPIDADELLASMHMPDRLYPDFSREAAWVAGIALFAGTQLALLVPSIRLWRLRCVDALREQE